MRKKFDLLEKEEKKIVLDVVTVLVLTLVSYQT